MLEPSSSEEEDEDYLPPNYGQTLEPPGVHQNGGPPRAVSPGNMSVDGVNKGGAGSRLGGGASPTPSQSSEKTLTEAEIAEKQSKEEEERKKRKRSQRPRLRKSRVRRRRN